MILTIAVAVCFGIEQLSGAATIVIGNTEDRRGHGAMHIATHIANTLGYCKEYSITLNREIII